ncbi:30S ribosomal protein S9 [Candidatus Gottesmanbacteria bacterium]|nr:30S ribosomal protein S9 [Candidatus Gottesmanbacteria bacterium]
MAKISKKENSKGKGPLYYHAVGRRKESTARVRLYPALSDEGIKLENLVIKKADIIVNGKPVEEYFQGEILKKFYLEPFRTTNSLGRFATSIKVVGGGITGQMGAVIHGIARALVKVDPEKNKTILRKRGFLTRDPREKERRKAGFAGKARAKKQSPKR